MDRWAERAEVMAGLGDGAWVFPAFRPCYGTTAAEVYKHFWWEPLGERDNVLDALAARVGGNETAPLLRRAWRALVNRLLPGRTAAEEGGYPGEAPESRRAALIRALTERHGAFALGLVGPWIIGGPATALLGVALGLGRRQLALGLAITISVMVTGYLLIVHAALR
jgi:hypothetical protein